MTFSKDIVVTGASGFVGSHLAKYLSNRGYKVYAITDPKSTTINTIKGYPGIELIPFGLNDYEQIRRYVPRGALALFHFAWAGVAPEYRKSVDIQITNVGISLDAVRLAKELDVKKFIFPGSTFEYSYSGRIINRDTPPTPQDAYGVAKISAKYFTELLCKEWNIQYIYVVISGIYSADRLDNNVITYCIKKLLNRERPSLTKLEQLWDYINISDVVQGLELIIDKGRDKAFYVLGHGDNWPLANYIYSIRDIIDPNLPLGIGDIPYESERIPMSCVDLSELKNDTGFEPKISFQDGIVEMIESIKRSI